MLKNYPASATALPLLTITTTGYLTEHGVSDPVAAIIGVVVGFAPLCVAKIVEAVRASK